MESIIAAELDVEKLGSVNIQVKPHNGNLYISARQGNGICSGVRTYQKSLKRNVRAKSEEV